ncbi:MAG: MgtC/SapB family protein [Rudaea sp.]
MGSQEMEMALKLVVAGLLGGLVGWEREVEKRPAGLRTHVLICVGAAMFGLIGSHYFSNTGDVSRVWQNIITGVGFLCAGVVFKEERSVHGLTTAAGIWAVAAIGLAVAAGLYFLSFTGEAIVLVTLHLLYRFEHHGPAEEAQVLEKRM